MRHRQSLLPYSALFVFALVGCGASTPGSSTPGASDDPFKAAEEQLTPLAAQCSFNATTGAMVVTVGTGETAIISKRVADSAILQNGQGCDVAATSATLKKITITGSAGDNTVILDFTNGLFATGTSSTTTTGISVDLLADGSNGDTLGIRGTTGVDNVAFGASGVNLNNDGFKDITLANTESYIVYLGDGNDIFTAAGGGAAGAVFGAALTVYGGIGDDTFNQGTAISTGETIWGGAGTDTVSYASRSGAVTVTVGATANDGESTEVDDINSDVEVVTGGSGADTMTAAAGVAITLNGGPGNDHLNGASAADTLNGDAGDDVLSGGAGNDVLNGGVGDDTFAEGTASNGGDIFNGGAGTDTVDYSARAANGVVVTMDGTAANDGETSELDNVKADVENIIGTGFVDNITGNTLNNKIAGGAGDDILSGGAGDDTFDEGAAANGDDTISGGAGVDTVDYSGRTGPATIVLDGATGSGESGEADLLGLDMENVIGSAGDDTITGNALNNELMGGAGDDTLDGAAGDDVLEGGALANTENNVLICGAGSGDIGLNEGSGMTASKHTDCEF